MVIGGFFAVVFTGEYPLGARDFLVNVYRYGLRLSDQLLEGLPLDTRQHYLVVL